MAVWLRFFASKTVTCGFGNLLFIFSARLFSRFICSKSGLQAITNDQPRKKKVSFWNHHAAMSESNDCRLEARQCLRKANRGDDKLNRWAWLVLAKTWLLLAETQEIAAGGG